MNVLQNFSVYIYACITHHSFLGVDVCAVVGRVLGLGPPSDRGFEQDDKLPDDDRE